MEEFKYNAGKIVYRESYWDERVMGFPTIDIVNIEAIDEIDYSLLLKEFLGFLDDKYHFVSFRMSLEDSALKKELIKYGFVLVEQSYVVECLDPKFKSTAFSNLEVDFLSNSPEDIEDVKRISKEDFHFGRFFEDPFIKIEIAKKRNEYWVSDMINDKKCKVLTVKKNNSVIGFMAFREEENVVEMLLGGLTSKFSHLSYTFWAYLFEYYFKNKLIRSTISSSNLGIVNLYSRFGFNFSKKLTGFHLHK